MHIFFINALHEIHLSLSRNALTFAKTDLDALILAICNTSLAAALVCVSLALLLREVSAGPLLLLLLLPLLPV